MSSKYPYYSPYLFAGNKPSVAIDWNGMHEYVVTRTINDPKKPLEVNVVTEWKANNNKMTTTVTY